MNERQINQIPQAAFWDTVGQYGNFPPWQFPPLGDELLPQGFIFLWVHNKSEVLRGLLKLSINGHPFLDLKFLVLSRGFVDQLAFPIAFYYKLQLIFPSNGKIGQSPVGTHALICTAISSYALCFKGQRLGIVHADGTPGETKATSPGPVSTAKQRPGRF